VLVADVSSTVDERATTQVSLPRNLSSLATAVARKQSLPRQLCLHQSLTCLPRDLPPTCSPTPFISSSADCLSHFRDDDLEEDQRSGDSQSEDLNSVSCSRYTKASTSESTDISFRSPISIVSMDAQPNLFSFSDSNVTDNCISNLFTNNSCHSDSTRPEQVSPSISVPNPPPPTRNFSHYFPCFWTCNIRGGLTSKLDDITQILLVNNVIVAVLVETWLHGGIRRSNLYSRIFCL